MLKTLPSTMEYIAFAKDINSDSSFCVPSYSSDEELLSRLLDSPKQSNKLVLGCFEGEALLGLFVLLVEEQEQYLEMLMPLSRSAQAYEELWAFLRERFPGWQCDFVFKPNNRPLRGLLEQSSADFDVEQQKMLLTGEPDLSSDSRIQLYSPQFRAGYAAIHSTDVYWTAEKVLAAPERFRIILAIENNQVVGYIDITHNYEENEPFDVFVKENCRRKGYARAMLAKAIELNRPKAMVLTVNVDNAPAIALYESMGFTQVKGQNSITAHLTL